MYGAVMGLAGLGLSARAAATVFPGFLRAPAYFTELWVALGALLLAVLLPLYLLKLLKFPAAVQADFTNPAALGFCGALPVGMTLVAGGIAPYAPAIANVAWWIGVLLLFMFQIWALVRWLSGGIDLAKLNAGWLIILVGGIVVPGPGIALGHIEASRFFFGVSATIAPVLTALLLYRAMVAAAARGAAPELVHPAGAAVADLCQRRGAVFPRVSGNPVFLRAGPRRGAARLRAQFPALALRAVLVGVYLPARRSGFRRRALRAEPPFAAVEVGRRGGAGRGDAFCGGRSLANCSQRCIASGVNSACGWLPPMMNIRRCSLPGSS